MFCEVLGIHLHLSNNVILTLGLKHFFGSFPSFCLVLCSINHIYSSFVSPCVCVLCNVLFLYVHLILFFGVLYRFHHKFSHSSSFRAFRLIHFFLLYFPFQDIFPSFHWYSYSSVPWPRHRRRNTNQPTNLPCLRLLPRLSTLEGSTGETVILWGRVRVSLPLSPFVVVSYSFSSCCLSVPFPHVVFLFLVILQGMYRPPGAAMPSVYSSPAPASPVFPCERM